MEKSKRPRNPNSNKSSSSSEPGKAQTRATTKSSTNKKRREQPEKALRKVIDVTNNDLYEPIQPKLILIMIGGKLSKFTLRPDLVAPFCPTWTRITSQTPYGLIEPKEPFFKDSDTELALKLVLQGVHGSSEGMKSILSASAKTLYYVAEVWVWLGRPDFSIYNEPKPGELPTRDPMPPVRIVKHAIKALIRQTDTKDIGSVEDWLLLGVVADRFDFGKISEVVQKRLVHSLTRDGRSLLDAEKSNMTTAQLVAFRELYLKQSVWNARSQQLVQTTHWLRWFFDQMQKDTINQRHETRNLKELQFPDSTNGTICPTCADNILRPMLKFISFENMRQVVYEGKAWQGSVYELLAVICEVMHSVNDIYKCNRPDCNGHSLTMEWLVWTRIEHQIELPRKWA